MPPDCYCVINLNNDIDFIYETIHRRLAKIWKKQQQYFMTRISMEREKYTHSDICIKSNL